ncbi:DUF485 domain-containing protein [Streptomyces chiangmaiensis]|uniref:DUF485 domain-containing protein n=1 Tax=Streptomyces chiangmaiensis TaxID=766497 RepID=A0ABU7FIA9_9ACTN|nr:DUF485 domain-containing protein [Streptomyces chiangmaiensis]MED7823856.1 DUF485 domain-containing protein [Streptomyces chiangmaiensis]
MKSSNGRPSGDGGGPESPVEKHEGRDAAPTAMGAAGHMRHDDPWYDALASGWGELDGTGAPAPVVPPARREDGASRAAQVYLEVQRSAAFQEVRSRYRRFVIPGIVAAFSWYLGYVVAAQTAPGLMARPVAGAVNVAMLAGLGQFLTTFVLTWAYARHARLHRDRAALDLRWDTQELTRGLRGGES